MENGLIRSSSKKDGLFERMRTFRYFEIINRKILDFLIK